MVKGPVMAGKKHSKVEKTNAVRALEAAGIDFSMLTFETDVAKSGLEVARILGQDPDQVFKTLVTQGKSGSHYVFMVPVEASLDLRKAAAAVGEKNVEMIASRGLLPLTGYVHGGCSPLGMKKQFPTVIDETAQLFDRIMCSGGRIGFQICIAPDDLQRMVGASFADITQ